MDDNSSAVDSNNSERQRDRSRRGEKGTRFSDVDSVTERDRSANRGVSKRIYVSNIPYEYRWQDLKDLFRRVVGTVEFVELFVDENNKARGCGIVEFKDAENVQKALEKMNRYELSGREIVVKEDHGEERDKYGRIGRKGGEGGGIGGGGGGGSRGGNRSSGNNSSRDRGRDRSTDNFMLVKTFFFHFFLLQFQYILVYESKANIRGPCFYRFSTDITFDLLSSNQPSHIVIMYVCRVVELQNIEFRL